MNPRNQDPTPVQPLSPAASETSPVLRVPAVPPPAVNSPIVQLTEVQLTEVHLTDEQFTGLLLGSIPPAVIAHLESCSGCAQEADRVSGAIGSFAQQSRLWAENRATARRAATHPVATQAQRTARAWLGTPVAPVAWAAAALAVIAGIGVAHQAGHPASAPQALQAPQAIQTVAAVPPAPGSADAPAGPVNPATLKADNQLLSAIDGELTDSDISGAQYSLAPSRHPARQRSSKGISN
jgi:hypothetical protein